MADPDLTRRLRELAEDRRWDCWSMHGQEQTRVQSSPSDDYRPAADCCDAADGWHTLRAAADRIDQLEQQLADLHTAIERVNAVHPLPWDSPQVPHHQMPSGDYCWRTVYDANGESVASELADEVADLIVAAAAVEHTQQQGEPT